MDTNLSDSSSPGWSDQESTETTSGNGWSDSPNPLKATINAGSKIAPEQAAQVLKLQDQTGLAPDLIHRNLEDVQSQAQAIQTDPDKLKEESPNTASWLSKSPYHAAIAADDLFRLKSIERISADMGMGAYRGSLELERSALWLVLLLRVLLELLHRKH